MKYVFYLLSDLVIYTAKQNENDFAQKQKPTKMSYQEYDKI